MTVVGGGAVPIVFTFSVETYDDAVQREFCRPPDQTLRALAASPDTGLLLAVDPWRSWPVDAYRRRPLRTRSTVEVAGRPVLRVRPRRLRRRDPRDPEQLRRVYAAYSARLRDELRRAAPGAPPAVLVTFHPFVAAWCTGPWFSRTVYVGRDDWASSPPERPYHHAFRTAYRDLDRPDVQIFAVSRELADRLSPERAVVVPNGVDGERWAVRRSAPDWMARAPRPVAVYAGTIDDRLDVELLRRTACLVGSTVLVGPAPDPRVTEALSRIDGVHLAGRLGQDELAAAVMNADIGLLPHVDTAMTRAMSPLKLYEYLSGGLAVAAVDLPPVRDVHERVHLAHDPGGWDDAVRAALAEPRLSEAERLELVRAQSWSARLRPVVEAASFVGRRP